jgi:hypothetical protein
MKCESISFFCQKLPQEFIIAIVYLLTRRILAKDFSENGEKSGKNRD